MVSLIISIVALSISGATFYFTRLEKGTIKMTRPTIICFVPPNGEDTSKVFIRTLLYSTSERGRYIQNISIQLKHEDSSKNFDIWAYDDDGLKRGSGLYVNKSGVAYNHHFLLAKNEMAFNFLLGNYILQVFVETSDGKQNKIFEQRLWISKEQSEQIQNNNVLYFDWIPSTKSYMSYVDVKERKRV